MKNPGLRRRINFHGEAILHRICDFNLVAVGHIQENLTSNKRERKDVVGLLVAWA